MCVITSHLREIPDDDDSAIPFFVPAPREANFGRSWLEKPASRLVKHFFATYATQFAAMPVVDPRRYCLVSTATGAEIASGPLGETVGGEGCVLSVCPRVRCAPVVAAVETARSAADDATLSEDDVVEVEEDDVIEVDEETQLHDIELPTEVVTGEFTDAELLMADDDLFKYYMLEMYEHKNNNNKHVQYMKAREQMPSCLILRARGFPPTTRVPPLLVRSFVRSSPSWWVCVVGDRTRVPL